MATQTDRAAGVNFYAAIKVPVLVATTAAITLTGEQSVDGVTTNGSRVLVKNQVDQTTNGVYVSDNGDWVRANDFDGNTDLVKGTLVFVTSGSTNSGNIYQLTTADPVTIGTSNLTFSDISTTLIADGTVTTNKLADGAVTSAKLANGAVANSNLAQMAKLTVKANTGTDTGTAMDAAISTLLSGASINNVFTTTGSVSTGSTMIPLDDTTPQINEGDQYMSVSITPTNASSKLLITGIFNVSPSSAAGITVALFQDSASDAIAAVTQSIVTLGLASIPIVYEMTAGTTSSTTIKLRAGPQSTFSLLTFNGVSGGRYFGGKMASTLRISEILP